MEDRFYTADEFLLKLLPSQKYTGIIFLNLQRENQMQPYKLISMKILNVAVFFMIIECILNVVRIIIEIREDRLNEAKEIAAVFSMDFLMFMRAIFLKLNSQRILDLCNNMDQIFPRDRVNQKRVNVTKFAKYFEKRHRYVCIGGTIAIVAFFSTPLLEYLIFYNASENSQILDKYHIHQSWFPYNLKQNPRFYLFIYIYEVFITLCYANSQVTWDHMYSVNVAQLVMHFDFVNSELETLNSKDTLDAVNSKEFYKRLKDIIKYHQHVSDLGYKLRDTFSLSHFVGDNICAATICFHLYLMINSDSFMSIVLIIFPCMILIVLTFDYCYQGSRVKDVTSRMSSALVNQNWYEGSIKYRKLLITLLQFANKPFVLSGYKLFEVDMQHFRSIMMIAYRLLTFLQSRNN